MKTFIKSGFWATKKTGATPKGWIDLTKLIKDNSGGASENSFFGYRSGYSTSAGYALSNATNSVFIGFYTRANAHNETNQIVIGHSAIGDGSNSVVLGNSSITRTRLQGQVIMGSFTSAPTGIEGAIYYNSTDKKHYGFNGTTWNALY